MLHRIDKYADRARKMERLKSYFGGVKISFKKTFFSFKRDKYMSLRDHQSHAIKGFFFTCCFGDFFYDESSKKAESCTQPVNKPSPERGLRANIIQRNEAPIRF